MSDNHTDTDREKLRAFEKKMHDEGAAGFADGPCPWETWDDKTGLLGNKRVWEGTSKRIYPKKHAQPSLGDRVLSGLAMLSLATMVVGIAGVYFSDHQPLEVAVTGVQPLPIERTPPATDEVIASLEQLPATAAGEAATDSPQDAAAQPAPATPAEPDSAFATGGVPTGDSALQAPALPEIAAEFSAKAYVEVAAAVPEAESPDTDDNVTEPVPAAPAAETLPESPSEAAPVSVAADTASAAAMTAEQAATPAVQPPPPAAVEATPDTTAGITVPQTTDPVAATAPASTAAVAIEAAEPAMAPEITPATAGIADDAAAVETPAMPTADDMAAAVPTPVPAESAAAAATDSPQARAETATTVAGLEALPATMAATAATEEAAAEDGSTGPVTEDVVVAVTEQDDRPAPATSPAAAAEDSMPVIESGDWVVNLAAYTRESMASRMLKKFRDQGVDAELVSVVINDQPMYRIRVAGFASSAAARARIYPLEQQLGLEGVWIGKR